MLIVLLPSMLTFNILLLGTSVCLLFAGTSVISVDAFVSETKGNEVLLWALPSLISLELSLFVSILVVTSWQINFKMFKNHNLRKRLKVEAFVYIYIHELNIIDHVTNYILFKNRFLFIPKFSMLIFMPLKYFVRLQRIDKQWCQCMSYFIPYQHKCNKSLAKKSCSLCYGKLVPNKNLLKIEIYLIFLVKLIFSFFHQMQNDIPFLLLLYVHWTSIPLNRSETIIINLSLPYDGKHNSARKIHEQFCRSKKRNKKIVVLWLFKQF